MCKKLIQSPINYVGSKFELVDKILPHFPKQIDTFLSLFDDGCVVGINVNANHVVFHIDDTCLLQMYIKFQDESKGEILDLIDDTIKKYDLSRSEKKGYKFYGCERSIGLASYNRERFNKLRSDFNEESPLWEGVTNLDKYYVPTDYVVKLYVLCVFAFNNQIRFSRWRKFTSDVGNHDFNKEMRSKLCTFIDRVHGGSYSFAGQSLGNYEFWIRGGALQSKDFVYCESPYLISCNEEDGYREKNERYLYSLFDKLNKNDIKFALLSKLSSNGKTNETLVEWLNNRDYRRIDLRCDYTNSSYQKKDKTSLTEEVLIVNYGEMDKWKN
jgi:site-specific DNA-adenine methylase